MAACTIRNETHKPIDVLGATAHARAETELFDSLTDASLDEPLANIVRRALALDGHTAQTGVTVRAGRLTPHV